LQGFQAAIDHGISCLQFETDALMVKHALTTNDFDMSESGGLVQELKELIRLNVLIFWLIITQENVTKLCML
jgi:hypothetical protein